MQLARRLVFAGVLLATSGCSTSPDAPTSSTPAPSSTAPSGPNDIDADLPAPPAPPTDDAPSRTAAEQAAADTMVAFMQVDLDADDWLAGMSAHLTPAATADYLGTDPLEVPARQLTGPARYAGSTSAYLATVTVPTDVGDYQLLLVREGQGAPWLAETLTPPEGLR